MPSLTIDFRYDVCQDAPAFYALKADALGGDGTLEFSSLKGNVVLVTNVASK